MKVAFFTSTFPKISETFIINQVVGLLEKGHDVTIFAMRRQMGQLTHDIVNEYSLEQKSVYTSAPQSYSQGVQVIGKYALQYPKDVSEIFRSIRKGREGGLRIGNLLTFRNHPGDFDLYHVHFGSVFQYYDFLTSDLYDGNTPTIVSFYGKDVGTAEISNDRRYKDLFEDTDKVIGLSTDMLEQLESIGCSREKLQECPLCIDTTKFNYNPRIKTEDEPFKIITVSRLTEKKGIEFAIDAIARLSDKYDISYQIAGDGPLRPEIERRIKRRGIEESTELLGWVDQQTVEDVLSDAHMFLLPSRTASDGDREGTPTVLLEAQAAGLPVVSTYHAGIPEIVADGESGILVPEADTEQLVAGLEQMFEGDDQWPQMGKQGRDLVESTHSIPTIAERLEQIYQAEVNQSRGLSTSDKNE